MPKNEKFKKTNQNNEKSILSQKPYNNQKQAQQKVKMKSKTWMEDKATKRLKTENNK